MFKQLGIRVVTGRRFLGGFIGGKEDVHQWFKQKIESWVGSVKKISNVAKTQPQAAFTGFTKSLQAEWAFIQRVMVDSEENFRPLREAIHESSFLICLLHLSANTKQIWFVGRVILVG